MSSKLTRIFCCSLLVALMALMQPLSKTIAQTDEEPPTAVINLVARPGSTPGAIELSWLAPGDDGSAGTASAYVVRYHTTHITDSNWATSNDVAGEPPPSLAGSQQAMVVSGLEPGQSYYFAIRAEDEVHNLAGLSNSASTAAAAYSRAVYLPVVLSGSPGVLAVIPDTTEVLTPATTQFLTSISNDGNVLTFSQSTPALTQLSPGDVIVGGVTANAPAGFLLKVVSIMASAGQVVVTTQPAVLEEAIESGTASVSQSLDPDQVQAAAFVEGVQSLGTSDLKDGFYLELKDVVLYDHDGNPNTKTDRVLVTGSTRLKPEYDFSLIIRHFELQELSFIVRAEETSKLELEAKAELPLIQKKVEIARYTFAPVTVMVGPVPVVFVPVLTVNVGVDGSVYVGLRSEVSQVATLKAGLRYADQTWRPVADFSNQFNYSDPPTLQPTAGVDAKGYANTQIALMLYGLAGAYAELQTYLELEVDAADSPWWVLYGGLEVPVGVKIDVLSRSIASKEIIAIGYRLALAHAQSNNPPDEPFSPYPVDHAVDQTTDVNLSWSGFDPDGSPLTFDIYFEAWDDIPDVTVSQNQASYYYDPGPLIPSTLYYWQIVARDSQGATKPGPIWSFTTASAENSGVVLTRMYTADYRGQPQNVFRPGESIYLAMEGTNPTSQPANVLYHWTVLDPGGTPVPELAYADWAATIPAHSTQGWWLARGAPRDHSQGLYRFVGTVTHGAASHSASILFTVMGDPVPLTMVQAMTCKEVKDTWPYSCTSSFTSADAYVYAWTEWEGASGAHTVQWDWYRPDGARQVSDSYNFNSNYELFRTWHSVAVSDLLSYPGTWNVIIKIDGTYAINLVFNLSAAAQPQLSTFPEQIVAGMVGDGFPISPVPAPEP